MVVDAPRDHAIRGTIDMNEVAIVTSVGTGYLRRDPDAGEDEEAYRAGPGQPLVQRRRPPLPGTSALPAPQSARSPSTAAPLAVQLPGAQAEG